MSPLYGKIYEVSLINRISGFTVFFVFSIIINKLIQARRHYKLVSDELSFANKELESFSYSVAHDLKAPLSAINGFCCVLLEDSGLTLNKESVDLVNRIKMNSEKMAMLINDLLKLSKVSLHEINLQVIDLSEIANTIADELKVREPQRKFKFRIESGLKAMADKNLITNALFNLLENAWKYTSKRDTAQIEFGLKHQDKTGVFYVKDNGCGFDMKDSSRIFEPFKRLHSESQFPGTGIGMATVERIIRRHGGRIWAEGEVDKGATFYFTLPR
ncbi:MAG TPA: ATP-binding protein [Chitinispirillaceae bacterium]|nr:ATP-binding protein [Chitinispirillaceae bacterium]